MLLLLFPDSFYIYSIAFIACDYDPLNTFAELIVKTLKCHFKLHIKVKQNAFSFPIKIAVIFFLHRLFFYSFQGVIVDRNLKDILLKLLIQARVQWKFWNLYLASIKYEIFIGFLSCNAIWKWQQFVYCAVVLSL